MLSEQVIIQGAGGHAKVVLECLLQSGKSVLAIFDPKHLSGNFFGIPQRGAYDASFAPHAKCIIAIGNNDTRRHVAAFTKHAFTIVRHETAIVSPNATIGTGSMLLHRCILQAGVAIGKHVIVNTGAQIDHDCKIGDYVHVAPGAVLCGGVVIGEGTLIGANATIIPAKKIGSFVTIGAGAVVIDDIPDYAVVVGSPARIVRREQQK